MITDKACHKCGGVYPATSEYFSKASRNTISGIRGTCKNCDMADKRVRERKMSLPFPPPLDPNNQVCRKCVVEKPLSEFYKDQTCSDGIAKTCKDCADARKGKWKQENADKVKGYHRKSNLNQANRKFEWSLKRYCPDMTTERYQAMLEAQDGVCAICGEPPKDGERLFVDHDHVTGQARGLLCRLCNFGIGNLRDDIGILRAAITYLQKHKPMDEAAD